MSTTSATQAFPMAEISNGQALARSAISTMPLPQFQRAILDAVQTRQRICALFGSDKPEDTSGLTLYVVLADDHRNRLHVAKTRVTNDGFPSLTPQCPQVHLFEREIAEQFGVKPLGHPWLKPVRSHRSYRVGVDAWNRGAADAVQAGLIDFYQITGGQAHEVAVGPIHAGVIEPGHFRFQCDGEMILHLEIALGYQHRGVERALQGGPDKRSLHYTETLAGDTTVGHACAYTHIMESLGKGRISPRAAAIRGIAMELERLANHIGDLGALSGDVGFLPTASFCGRIRGECLNMTAALCGNRFGRGILRIGGVGFDLDAVLVDDLLKRLNAIERDASAAINLLWETSSVMARFEGIGVISDKVAREIGMVGPAARACGLDIDLRRDHPSGIYQFSHIPVSTWRGGDVFARAYVRWLEIQRSFEFIKDQLKALPAGLLQTDVSTPQPDALVVSLQEAWRGQVCHVALTNCQGRFERYKIVDPSFHNWMAVAMAVRGQQISDFPLCNKSFNLSYCGHDL